MGLTPEQRAAGEATLREWRRHQPDQVPCHYCGTLLWLQNAEPVPDNPADPYDRYACAACGADGQGGHQRPRDRGARRHRARQLRARIVEGAQELRAAYEQHEAAYAALMRADELACEWEREQEERLWEALDVRREALFALLEGLEGLEGAGS